MIICQTILYILVNIMWNRKHKTCNQNIFKRWIASCRQMKQTKSARFLPLFLIFRIQTKITRLSVTHKLFHSNISRFRCTKLQNNLFSTMQESTVIITNCSSTAELFGRLKKRKISYISFSYSLQSIARIIIYSRTILRKSNNLHFVP